MDSTTIDQGSSTASVPPQHMRFPRRIVLAGLILYAASFFLSAARTPILEFTTVAEAGSVLPLHNARQAVPGLSIAFLFFLAGVFASPDPVAIVDAIVVGLAWLANMGVIVAWLSLRRERVTQRLAIVLIASTVVAWLPAALLPEKWESSPLLPGYYIWAIAVTLIAIGVAYRTWTADTQYAERNRRRIRTAVVAGAIVIALGCASASATVRGATRALIDQSKGQLGWYQLGCVDRPPYDPLWYRVWELFGRDYGVRFHTVGGIGPNEYDLSFVRAYNAVADRILRFRFGNDYANRLRKQAASDVYTRSIVINGCYDETSHALFVGGRNSFGLDRSKEAFEEKARLDHRLVTVEGSVVDVRGSRWRNLGRQVIKVKSITERDGECAPHR